MEEQVFGDTPALEPQQLPSDTPAGEPKPKAKRGRPKGSGKADKTPPVRKIRSTKETVEKKTIRRRGRKKNTKIQSELFSFEDRIQRKLERAIVKNLAPVGAMEKALAEMIATSIWRLQKIQRIEYNAAQMQSLAIFEAQIESSFYRALEELSKLQGARKSSKAVSS